MDNINRREMFLGLAALAATAAEAQVIVPHVPGEKMLDQSASWTYDSLPVTHNDNGGESLHVTEGVLATGEFVAVHETVLPPGQMPHPPHKHRNSEFVFIREGQLDFYHDDKTERVGPGGIMFNASNKMHGCKNVGATPARYFVIEISRATVGATPVGG
jgi:quercetin dioxygenase-like cupin family protein